MPIRYHMTRNPLAGPCSSGSSTSTEYASSAMSWVADEMVMNSAMRPSIAAALAASARRPVRRVALEHEAGVGGEREEPEASAICDTTIQLRRRSGRGSA